MTISIIHNLGLGDHIIMAPIVAKIASERRGKIMLPCWKHNRESVASFFVNYPNVLVCAIEKESELRDFEPALKFGHYGESPRGHNEDFITWFYRQANFPLEDRDKWCPLKGAAEKVEKYDHVADKTTFIHDDPSRGYEIDDDRIDHKHTWNCPFEKDRSILAHVNRLCNAAEIHCIDSSFLHLADALPTTGKLFFHRYARAGEHNKGLALRKKWEVIE